MHHRENFARVNVDNLQGHEASRLVNISSLPDARYTNAYAKDTTIREAEVEVLKAKALFFAKGGQITIRQPKIKPKLKEEVKG